MTGMNVSIGKINLLAAYTTDGGATWSDLIETNSPTGSQPPTLYFDGEFIWHLWPNRKTVYESRRGTFAPIIKGASVSGAHTYSRQAGGYIVDGYMVHVWVSIVVSFWDSAASGQLEVTLPFSFPDTFPDTFPAFGPAAGASFRRLGGLPAITGDGSQYVAGIFEGRNTLELRIGGGADTGVLAENISDMPVVELSIS